MIFFWSSHEEMEFIFTIKYIYTLTLNYILRQNKYGTRNFLETDQISR